MSHPSWRITKFGLPKSGSPTEVAEFKRKNGLAATKKEYGYCLITETPLISDPLLTVGMGILWNLVIGGGDTPFSNTNARLGVSSDSTAFNASQTTLDTTGSGNMYMQLIDPTFPIVSGNQTSWEATFDGFTWNEDWQSFGVDNDAVDGAGNVVTSYDGLTIGLLNRLVEDEGTKPSGQTWILTLIIQQS